MFRKLSLIFFLALAFGIFLVVRPYLTASEEKPSILDRLPDADFIGRCYVLNLAKESNALLFHNRVPFREFLTEEFILAQGKNYGLQFQNPSYIFANEKGNWGVVIEVSDSSKVSPGLSRLAKSFPMTDTTVMGISVHAFNDFPGYIIYEDDYLLFYYGKNPSSYIKRVALARKNMISPYWRQFLNRKVYQSKSLSISSNWEPLKQLHFDASLFYPEIDSSQIIIHTSLKTRDTLPISLKEGGPSLAPLEYTKRIINLHLNVDRLKQQPNHPIYKLLVQTGKKVGFPTQSFLSTWDGEFAFRQGGFFTVKEKYIESELDENFNVLEVEKTRDIRVLGLTMRYSVQKESQGSFIKNLLNKGVLTEQENKFYFLLSPPLRFKQKKDFHLFYSSNYPPVFKNDTRNFVAWYYEGTTYTFDIDKINTFEVNGRITIPFKELYDSKLNFTLP